MTDKQRILVTGDLVVDHHIYKGERIITSSKMQTGTRIHDTLGGAYLIFSILEKYKKEYSKIYEKEIISGKKMVIGFQFGLKPVLKEVGHMAYAEWQLRDKFKNVCSYNPKLAGEEEYLNWDLHEKLGYSDQCLKQTHYTKLAQKEDGPHDLLVIDDGYLGFRAMNAMPAWPQEIVDPNTASPWILYKMSRPLAQGDLWQHITRNPQLQEKLITLVTLDDLRREDVHISKGLSWERTALDLVRELHNNHFIHDLQKKSRHLVVLIGMEGAVYVHNACDPETIQYRLIFDPDHLEGEVEEKSKPMIIGKMATFTAALAASILGSIKADEFQDGKKVKPQIRYTGMEDGIAAGLAAIRKLYQTGHIQKISHLAKKRVLNKSIPAYPYRIIIDEILAPSLPFAKAFIPNPAANANPDEAQRWTILENNYHAGSTASSCREIDFIARRVALRGKRELKNVPSLSLGKYFTVDRGEIENLRIIRNIILDYHKEKAPQRPLSIAVFGPPGAGKSFVVKQIAREVLKQEKDSLLEFNLSQFSTAADLIGAFHQVRDRALENKLPFVFWDEFDAENFRWLQYLLAPMQDGKFQEGQVTHPIGKCIFVFAGGTSATMQAFGIQEPAPKAETLASGMTETEYIEWVKAYHDFRLKKGPDFKSRLNAYLNMLGPNPHSGSAEDACFPIRRATFMREVQGLNDRELDMDWGLLKALLSVSKYAHGSRSYEKLLSCIQGNHTGRYVRSDLPPEAILAELTDQIDFMARLHIDEDEDLLRLADRIAMLIHASWQKATPLRPPEFDRDFDYLPIDVKMDNVDAGAKIKPILEKSGYSMKPDTTPAELLIAENEHELFAHKKATALLEKLAALEHERWCRFREANGWRYAAQRNDYLKLHNCLKPYDQLSEDDKEKDRASIRKYPLWLGQEGYRIVKK